MGNLTTSTFRGKGIARIFANHVALRLEEGDLGRALKAFEKECGQEPAMIGIIEHKSTQAIIAEALSQGLKVIHEPLGMLSFEIWLYPHDGEIPTPRATENIFLATTKFNPLHSCQNCEAVESVSVEDLPPLPAIRKPQTEQLRGRPKKDIPMDRIKELGEQDFGAKAIAGRLKAEGYKVSFRTVHRVLVGERT